MVASVAVMVILVGGFESYYASASGAEPALRPTVSSQASAIQSQGRQPRGRGPPVAHPAGAEQLDQHPVLRHPHSPRDREFPRSADHQLDRRDGDGQRDLLLLSPTSVRPAKRKPPLILITGNVRVRFYGPSPSLFRRRAVLIAPLDGIPVGGRGYKFNLYRNHR